jgi:hypothetical protein
VAWGLGFLFQLLDLGPDTLVGAERFLKCASLQTPLLDRPHNAFRLPTEVGELAPPIGNCGSESRDGCRLAAIRRFSMYAGKCRASSRITSSSIASRRVLAQAPRLATVDHLVRLKKYWTVSVAALAYRLHTAGVLTDWHYRMLCIEIASRGYRKQEPDEASRETSQVLAKVFAALRDESVAKRDIAADLHITSEAIEQLVFGLIVTGLTGGIGQSPSSGKKRGQLRVVDPPKGGKA